MFLFVSVVWFGCFKYIIMLMRLMSGGLYTFALIAAYVFRSVRSEGSATQPPSLETPGMSANGLGNAMERHASKAGDG